MTRHFFCQIACGIIAVGFMMGCVSKAVTMQRTMKSLVSQFPSEIVFETDIEIDRRFNFDDCDFQLLAAPDYDVDCGRVILAFSGRGNTPTAGNFNSELASEGRRKLLAAGYMIVMPYCGSDSWGSPEATTAAIVSLRRVAEDLRITLPPRIPVVGCSMGGLAGLMFAVRYPERVSKIVDFFGSVDVRDTATRQERFAQCINALYPDEAALDDASPLNHGDILARFPVKIYHGDADTVIPLEQSRRMERCLLDHGGKVEFEVVPAIGHDNALISRVADSLLEFIERK